MSAPIDDLLYDSGDSGDEDMAASVPMRSFSTPLPLATGLAPLPLAPAGLAPGGGPVAATTAATPAKPLPTPPAAAASPAATASTSTPAPAIRPAQFPHVSAAGQANAAGSAATGAPPAKKTPGSGQQMFQQMFALLKQMLPAEQYATLHSEMRKGNGNDIKSIVDIIKRIAGDAIFSSVIQKMDLTRSFPPNAAAPATGVKAEPKAAPAAARIPQASTPISSAATTLGSAIASGGAATPTPGGITMTAARSQTLPLQGGVAATATGPIAAPSVLSSTPLTSRFVKPAGTAPGLAASLAGAATASVAKPSGAGPMGSRPTMTALTSAAATKTPPSTAVKPEPAATISTPPPSTVAASTSKGSGASPSSSPSSAKNEALEKILYAKRLLLHASTCSLEPGICQFKKCDDVRRVFKHSTSCGGANGCTHCEQLKGLVKYHAKECQHSLTEHCAIPFCDGLRRAYMSATAALGSAKSSAAASHALAAAARGVSGGKGGVLSDDDDDNTPLASAVSKVKKSTAKSKSPKSSVASKVGGGPAGLGGSNSKKKGSPGPSKAATAGAINGQATTGAGAMGVSTASGGGSPGGSASKGGNAVTANMTLEYGRLLQLILHVQKCTTSACPVGQECADAKSLLQQINSPNAPARAKTYKQVYAHYKVCLSKNNTSTCPMCKIGLQPILPTATSGLSAGAIATGSASRPSSMNAAQSPGSQATGGSKVAAGGSAGSSVAGSSASPSGSTSLKRTNSMTPSPRSPSKKQRTGGSKAKTGGSDAVAGASGGSGATSSASAAADASGTELVQASVADIRKEADVLTHTGIDLTAERRTMMGSRSAELLPCKKEEWAEADLFDSPVLTAHMRAISRRCGVTLGPHTNDVMAFALREYLKQVIEEMVEVAKQRSDACALSLAQLEPKSATGGAAASDLGGVGSTAGRMELTATDILRVSCEESFARLRQEDLSLRSALLEDAKREEMVERERAKKRKKVDRSKLAQEEKDEAEMDVEELATKDLKERLLREDKEGISRVDGRVNESISKRLLAPSRGDNQVTMEDAGFWLQSQKPYVKPKLFARAEVARIVTKALI